MTPVERVKCLLQVQGIKGEAAYKGPMDAASSLLKTGGIASLYKGFFATLVRDIPGSVAYFAAYEITKRLLTPKGHKQGDLSPFAILVAGGMAGVANWAVAIVSSFDCLL